MSVHFLLLFTGKKSSPEGYSDKLVKTRISILVIIMTLQLLRSIEGISCSKVAQKLLRVMAFQMRLAVICS